MIVVVVVVVGGGREDFLLLVLLWLLLLPTATTVVLRTTYFGVAAAAIYMMYYVLPVVPLLLLLYSALTPTSGCWCRVLYCLYCGLWYQPLFFNKRPMCGGGGVGCGTSVLPARAAHRAPPGPRPVAPPPPPPPTTERPRQHRAGLAARLAEYHQHRPPLP